jgi:hypothetical protein
LVKFVQGKDVFICNFCSKDQILSNWPFHMCILIHWQVTNVNISKLYVTLWITILPPSPKIGLLTFTMVWKPYIFIWLTLLSNSHFLCNCWGK